LFYELIQPLHYWSSIHNNPPEVVGVSRSNPPFPNLVRDIVNSGQQFYTLEGDRLIPSLVLSPWAFSDAVEQGGVHQYQLSIDREIVPNLVVKVAYAGSRGYNLTHLLDRNTAIPQRDANGVFPFFPEGSRRRNPAFTRVRDNAWDGSSWYNSFGLTVTKRFTQGYSLQGSYTYGKSIDNNSSTSVGESRSQPNGLSTLPEDVDFDRSLSDFDVRNRLSINGSWDLPFAAQNSILGGWRLTGILTAATGPRGTARLSFNWSRSGQTTDVPDRPSLIPGGNNNPVLSDGRDPNKYFDGNQFILGPRGYFGNLGRNTLQLPGLIVADFSVQKDFKFAEARMVQFRAEMFNFANRANFGSPSTATILDESGRRSSTTGRITATTSTSRQVQFGLKIYF
ncbi:MAG: hypothetical protein HYX74_00590, partial [Acidobacteria bacterium]|nr:hypothetical protein [Acidobacteriota bacterium]